MFFRIIQEVKNAQYYTDASNNEELSLVSRYVYKNEIGEVFVDFLAVERIIG